MKLNELVSLPLQEDWGSSDWYPIMKALKAALAAGTSLDDAAKDEASRYYKDMGYDDEDEAAENIVYMFKLRNPDIKIEATETKGAWKIQNLRGVMKNFKDAESTDAKAWMKNRGDAKQVWDKTAGWQQNPKQADRELKKQQRQWERDDREEARANKPKKRSAEELSAIYRKVEDAIGNSWPDGDPADSFSGYLNRNNYTMDDVDAAFKKHAKTTYYKYLENMWRDMAADAMHDAKEAIKRGQKPERSPYYDIINGDSVELNSNPWKSS